jgi:hypothetical protein
MSARVKFKDPSGEWVEGEEVTFERIREEWNEYRCEDGALVRVRLVMMRIIRLDKPGVTGEPDYRLFSQNVAASTPRPVVEPQAQSG